MCEEEVEENLEVRYGRVILGFVFLFELFLEFDLLLTGGKFDLLGLVFCFLFRVLLDLVSLSFGGGSNWGSAFLPVAQGTPLGNSTTPAEEARVRYIRNSRLPENVQRLQLDQLMRMNRGHQRHARRSGAIG